MDVVAQGTGVTPADRWFAVYQEKENTAPIIDRAYRALGIPEDQVRVLRLEPTLKLGKNPYHATQIGNRAMPRAASGEPAYLPVWKFIFGLTPRVTPLCGDLCAFMLSECCAGKIERRRCGCSVLQNVLTEFSIAALMK